MANYVIADRAAATAARDKQARDLREKIENRLAKNREIIDRAKLNDSLHQWENRKILAQVLYDENALRQLGDQPAPTRDEWRPSPSAVFERPGASHGRQVKLSAEEVADAKARGESVRAYAKRKITEGVVVVLDDEE
jgi:hypothetical protein